VVVTLRKHAPATPSDPIHRQREPRADRHHPPTEGVLIVRMRI
jgi:hypothetical protein